MLAGYMGSIRASFGLKRSKIGQEMAELWPIYQWEVALLQKASYGMYGASIRASFEPKRSKIGLEMAEYYQLAKERLREAVGH